MSDDDGDMILKVNAVAEEYKYIGTQICENCGSKRTYKMQMQRLVDFRGFPCDELDCVCSNCGSKKTFVFDITGIFEGYKNMFGN
ncbi:MAG: hypothetical protein JW776_04525 [Candidatus Lokiarchaeota archaeon]|nr:hypothetical protein [Candidatus Lokiarchaeota archaeon]